MTCPKCNAEIVGSPKFCPKCGAKVFTAETPTPIWTCPQCGTDNPVTARFCRKDGYRFDALPESPPVVERSSTVADSNQSAPAAAYTADTRPPATASSAPSSAAQPSRQPDTVISPPDGRVRCPQCGAINAPTAQFCKEDGYPLKKQPGAEPSRPNMPPQQTPSPRQEALSKSTQAEVRRLTPMMVVGSGVAVVLAASAAGGALYWRGYIGNRQGSVERTIMAELGRKGLVSVHAGVSRDWVATASGAVTSQAQKDQALTLLKQHSELKEVVDAIQVSPDPVEVEKEVNKAIADAGVKEITAQVSLVGSDLVATLGGTLTPGDEARLESSLKTVPAIKEFRRSFQIAVAPAVVPESPPIPASSALDQPKAIDAAALETRINKELHAAGFGNVIARVGADAIVSVSGTVASSADGDKAARLVSSVAGVAGVDDSITTGSPARSTASKPPAITAAATQTAAPPAPPPRMDPAKLEGDINRALRSGGLGGVTAQVGDDFSITLKGSATSGNDKNRAFQIARQFRGLTAVKDKIFVVEQ